MANELMLPPGTGAGLTITGTLYKLNRVNESEPMIEVSANIALSESAVSGGYFADMPSGQSEGLYYFECAQDNGRHLGTYEIAWDGSAIVDALTQKQAVIDQTADLQTDLTAQLTTKLGSTGVDLKARLDTQDDTLTAQTATLLGSSAKDLTDISDEIAAQTVSLQTDSAGQTSTLQGNLSDQTTNLQSNLDTKLATQTGTIQADITSRLDAKLGENDLDLKARLDDQDSELTAQTGTLQGDISVQTNTLTGRLDTQDQALADQTTTLQGDISGQTTTLTNKLDGQDVALQNQTDVLVGQSGQSATSLVKIIEEITSQTGTLQGDISTQTADLKGSGSKDLTEIFSQFGSDPLSTSQLEALKDIPIEGAITLEGVLRLILATTVNKGGPDPDNPGQFVYYNPPGTTARVTQNVLAGTRQQVAINVSD